MSLSPAAEAIWAAFNDAWERAGVFDGYGDALAAALRAAVEHCRRSDRTGMPYITPADLLDIARELENTDG